MTETLQGTPASPGIALGEVLVLKDEKLEIPDKAVLDTQAEIDRVKNAVVTARVDLEKVKAQALKALGKDQAQIFESHAMMLEDPEFQTQIFELIKNKKLNCERAIFQVSAQFIAAFEAMDNSYMRARATDIRDVSERLLRILLNVQATDLSTLDKKVVLIADDLTPSHAVTMNKDCVLGFLTNVGGSTSHTAILARSLEVPAVVGLKSVTQVFKTGDQVAFDGETGEVLLRPDATALKKYAAKQLDYQSRKEELYSLRGLPSETLDGHKVKVMANIGSHEDLPSLDRNDAEGIGLFRTEFIYLNRTTPPSEEDQFKVYKTIVSHMSKRGRTVIRTMDIGGDKQVPYFEDMKGEANPFLGLRAIRFCLQNPAIFKTQLRAILRASQFGKVGIMFPMISQLQELLEAKKIFEECKAELISQNIPVGEDIKLGIMIEVPSAALMSDILARNCDFFSIGTNDLIQYTCAVDRMNEKIKHLYTPFHPSVLRLLDMIIKNGRKNKIQVGMCGEMAGDRRFIPLLLGMGLVEFSMSPMSILPARRLIRQLKLKDCEALVEDLLQVERSSEAIKKLNDFLESHHEKRVS